MRESGFRFVLLSSSCDSWLRRITENLQQLWSHAAASPTSANGAPLHLLHLRRERRGRSQTASLVLHALIVAVLFSAVTRVAPPKPSNAIFTPVPPLYSPSATKIVDSASLGHKGGGGEDNPSPTTHGFFAPKSPIALAAPRLPDQENHSLPVAVTIFDADAPAQIAAMTKLGLPDAQRDTNSGGPGHNGIGGGKDGGMGESAGPGAGEGEDNGSYAPGVSLPACVYCPVPVYTDEARHMKLQGTVTLRVKVGIDGRASNMRVTRGIGYGLEERALEAVRAWKFKPAHDVNGRFSPAWITVEVAFHLF